ncbi:YfgM family protein [Pasteurella bettyae]|uniref:Ancillary SecYEG translocon subunit n=1 Tax=Pasteurella bettyae CCUG 2042 TaxID=1095749 RepID=I3D6A8_9PAST|nr:tetratricopeptide repeat protein [Pasteurella bettyae]EIJ67251.1 PF09976 family protein [Pasteurella bettyae CCUG 2042]SUB21205.1 tetratricopeptide-like helical family protein [Pasteurella bettyae]
MAYTSLEEQEINEIKNFWKENGKTIIVSAIIAIAGVFGWRYWQDYQIAKNHELSAQYDRVIYEFQQDPSKAPALAEFVKTNGKTSYATLALFEQAKAAVDKQDFAQAETILKQAITESPDEIFSSIAALRLANVQFQLKEFDAAQQSLDLVKDATWNVRKQLLTGDILFAKGDKAAAKAQYEEAKKSGMASALEQQLLQVRLNNL